MVTEYVFSEVNVMLRDLVYKLVIYINIKPKTISTFETLIDSDFSKLYCFNMALDVHSRLFCTETGLKRRT